jgi:23S rRNA (uracil1939-C5)-methyltransferase
MTDTPTHLTLQITSVAFGGRGVARHEGKVYFVADGIVGDQVLVSIYSDEGRYANATIVEIITPSPLRAKSPCRYSADCGGCQWQGINYDEQIQWKKSFIENSISRIAKSETPLQIIFHPSRLVQGYRNRILLKARIQPDGQLVFGYFKQGSRDFTSISQCLIANPRINLFLERLQKEKFSPVAEEIKFRFEIQDLPLKPARDPHLLITIYDPDSPAVDSEKIADHFSRIDGVATATPIRDLASTSDVPFDNQDGVIYQTRPGIFQQINVEQNHALRSLVLQLTDELKPKRILDVFCGSGNLSLQLAKKGLNVKGVEYSKRAIECAQVNLEINKLKNAAYFSSDAEKFLWREVKSQEPYDLIIVDPPREGMFKAMVPLLKLNCKHILYVSCDPTTLARDLGLLLRHRYKIENIHGLDFFPNTYHVESVVHLSLNEL